MAGLLGKMGSVSELAGGTKVLFLACAAVGSVQLLATLLPLSVQPHRVHVISSASEISSVASGAGAVGETAKAALISFDLIQIQARPIFLAGRRPITIASAPKIAAVQKEIKPDAGIFSARKLVGIIEEDQVVRILLWSKGDGGTILLRPGDPLGLWTFDRIEGETAVFVADQQQHRLVLKERDESAAGDAFVRKRSDSRKVRRNRRP